VRRVEVATGVWVVDYEAGIGGEGYDPPKPKGQRPVDDAVRYEEPVIVETDVEQRRREWEQSERRKVAGHTAIAAASQEQVAQ